MRIEFYEKGSFDITEGDYYVGRDAKVYQFVDGRYRTELVERDDLGWTTEWTNDETE